MALTPLFDALCDILSPEYNIEANTIKILQAVDGDIDLPEQTAPLDQPFIDVIDGPDAHPVCQLFKTIPFNWTPPQTSKDPLYQQHSTFKAHVELVGPTGLVPSSEIRLGIYGMRAHSEYGIRTHPAEEMYVMLAGNALWKRDDAPYERLYTGERSYHPSMMPHATKTDASAFMSIYIWDGDLSTEKYQYIGLPED